MTEDLASKIGGWLEKQGYPFELYVGNLFRRAGCDVQYARFYSDRETGESRPVDVLASVRERDSSSDTFITFSFAIECKVSRDHPWIVFAAAPSALATTVAGMPSYQAPDWIPHHALRESLEQDVSKEIPRTFQAPARLGHGIVKAFGDNRTGDPTSPYAAVQSAVAAAESIAKERELSAFRTSGPHLLSVVVPIVAVDTPLFEHYLDDTGQAVTAEVAQHLVLANSHSGGRRTLAVRIVGRAGLPDFVDGAAADAREVSKRIAPMATAILSDFRASPAASGA